MTAPDPPRLSTREQAALPGGRMSVLSRQWHPVQLKVPASSVENVVTAIRDNQDQAGHPVPSVRHQGHSQRWPKPTGC